MQRDKERVRLVIIIVNLCYWVCQNGVKGNTIKEVKAERNKHEEDATSVEENEELFEEIENTDDTETPDFDSDTTLYKRLQEMPLKLGIQLLTAKYGLRGSLDKAWKGGTHTYDGVKDAVLTMTDLIGEGVRNAKYLLFGTK